MSARRLHRPFAIGVVSAGLLGTPLLRAQEVLDVIRGEHLNARLGIGVCGLGDVNFDGFDEFVVARTPLGVLTDSLTVYSGIDRSELYAIPTILGGQKFSSMSRAGDVNRDGIMDFIVGEHKRAGVGTGAGVAVVYSGVDGAVLHTFHGPWLYGYLGYAVADAGDVDADGIPDLIVGAPQSFPTAWVYSGADGSVLHRLEGRRNQRDWFGASVDGVGDVNGDGYDDLIVGAPSRSRYPGPLGSVEVFSGRDGSVIRTISGSVFEGYFGTAVCGIGDVNRDGCPDFAVADGPITEDRPISIRIFSGADGSELASISSGTMEDRYARAVLNADGDFDGDGTRDLAIGLPGNSHNGRRSGTVMVASGLDGSILMLMDGNQEGFRFGESLAFVGKLNADQKDELLVGAPQSRGDVPPSWDHAGSAVLLLGGTVADLLLLAPTVGKEAGDPRPLKLHRATPHAAVYLAYSWAGRGVTSLPQLQVELELDGARLLGSTTADASGRASFPLPVPDRLRGRTIWLQAVEPGRVSNRVVRVLHWPWNWE